MGTKHLRNKHDLQLRQSFFSNQNASVAHAALMQRVFELDIESRDARAGRDPEWVPFAFFAGDGSCAGAVEAAVLVLVLDGTPTKVTAIRLAAVDPDWRGMGLFRDLMALALAWCETAAPGPTILYTEGHALYEPFAFRALEQHQFSGPPPEALDRPAARSIDPGNGGDLALIRDRLARRSPVSERCALVGAPSLFLANVLSAEDLVLAYASDLDALIVYEIDADSITLVDIVAHEIPTMVDLLATLPTRRRVSTLFPPDRLGWTSSAQPEDTGLMLRGPRPSAMGHPFMLPPTAEF